MPIIPAPRPTDRAAVLDQAAALLLVAWADLRKQRDLAPEDLAAKWQELRDALESVMGP